MTNRRILIVDDDIELAFTLTDHINDKGLFKAQAVCSGEDALEYLKKKPGVSLVLTDIKMAGMSGLELISRIKFSYPDIRVVVMTAYHLPEIQNEAYLRGSVEYIEKPFSFKKLEDVCERALNAKKTTQNGQGFVGKMASLNLVDVIQMNCIAGATNTIFVKRGDDKGLICFEQGEIIHCQCNNLDGEEAFYKLMTWEGGYLEILNKPCSSKRTIFLSYTKLLMEASCRIDESDFSGRSPPENDCEDMDEENKTEKITEKNEKTKNITNPEKKKEEIFMASRMEKLEGLIKELVAGAPEIEGAALAGTDGLTIASYLPEKGTDSNRVGASMAAMLGIGKRTLQALAKGDVNELSITGSKGALYLYDAGTIGILGVISKAEANVGMINMLARELTGKLSRAF